MASPAGTDGRSPNRHRARSELDPLGLEIGTLAGQVFYRLRDYDRAITQLQKTLDVEPNLPRAYSTLFRVYEAKGMDAEAVAACQQAIELNGPVSTSPKTAIKIERILENPCSAILSARGIFHQLPPYVPSVHTIRELAASAQRSRFLL